MIYGGTNGIVFAIDEETGDEIWRERLVTGAFINSASGGVVSVLLRDGIIVAGCNGHVWGINADTGETLWHNGLSGLGNSFVSLTDDKISVQHSHTHSHSQPHR